MSELDWVSKRSDRAIADAIAKGAGSWSGAPERVSRSRLQTLIERGHVCLNGVKLEVRRALKAGDAIVIKIPPAQPPDIIAIPGDLEILYEDEHIAVVNKPPGLSTHPSSTETGVTLVNILLGKLERLSGVGGELRPGIVHRLDKHTSGALVVTKTDAAHIELAKIFEAHHIERVYWALTYGVPHLEKGKLETKIESLIGRSRTDRKKMSMATKLGRKAITRVQLLERYAVPKASPFASWVEARLETGRTHQVRVHLTGLGSSLLGDHIYGKPTARQSKWLALPVEVRAAVERLPGQALHARVLGFRHPVTGIPLRFEAEPPQEFSNLLKALLSFQMP